jgi:hypothetical protein
MPCDVSFAQVAGFGLLAVWAVLAILRLLIAMGWA